MSGRRNIIATLGSVLSVSLIASIISVMLVSFHYSRLQFNFLNTICGKIVEQEPETEEVISAVLKDYICEDASDILMEDDGLLTHGVNEDTFLPALGYRISDFSNPSHRQIILFVLIGLLTSVSLFVFTFLYRNKTEAAQIQALTDYLEQVNTGKAAVLCAAGEDDFSKLEDEIYKTVTFLYHTRDAAVQAKDDFAQNLSNIAHQIKTPITAISLSVQMMKHNSGSHSSPDPACKAAHTAGHSAEAASRPGNYNPALAVHTLNPPAEISRQQENQDLKQIEKQILRLTHLEEALLVLSQIDAGTLLLQENETDVFTLLVLAADNLQELLAASETSIEIPELGEMMVIVNLDWTMEAVMNLMKNCMEHNPKGTIHCSYAQNPLYTRILIWDEGEGFAREDIPHLFERFYRGKNAGEGGIGIGLALAKEIIERQNGTIRAVNRPEGGALFEVRFYTH